MRDRHISSNVKRAQKMTSDNTLHVIGVVSNFSLWNSRYRLFRDWFAAMKGTPNVKLHIVELAHGDHCWELEPEMKGVSYLKLRTPHGHLWLKEAMIRAAIRYLLPKDWKYACPVDCDVFWKDKLWAQKTIIELQRRHVVQPWSTCTDQGPDGEAMLMHESFAYVLNRGLPMKSTWDKNYKYCHTGFAIAFDRHFYENCGVMDFCLVGSADHHFYWGCLGRMHDSVHGKMSKGFKDSCDEWAKKAHRITGGNIGFVNSHVEHGYHGDKQKRYYRERWSLFIDSQFCPKTDLMYDDMGLPYIVGKPVLDEEIRRYNLAREEDSI